MLSYTGKRLLQTIFVLLGISLITFVLLQVVPGDPVALTCRSGDYRQSA